MQRKATDTRKIPGGGAGTVAPVSATTAASKSNLAIVQKAETESCPFRSLINEWLDYCRSDGLAEKTRRDYSEKVFKFWWWWSEHSRYAASLGDHPKNVTVKEARAYASYLREPLAFRWGEPVTRNCQELSQASIASYGRAAKVFFNWLEREGYIDQTPFNKSVKFSNRHKQDKVLKNVGTDDLARIFAVLTQPEKLETFSGRRNLAMIALLLDSGMRRGELLSLRVCDIDLVRCRCVIRGKTGQRYALFSPRCKDALTTYILKDLIAFTSGSGDTISLWMTQDGYPLAYNGFSSVIRQLEKDSGVDFHAHKLRHTFATMMAQQGVNVFDLKEMMGHSSITTTQVYVQQNIERLSEVYKPRSPLTTLAGEGERDNKIPGLRRRRGRPSKGH